MGRIGLLLAITAFAGCGDDSTLDDGGTADAAGSTDGGSTPDTPPGAKRIFITSTTFDGQLVGFGGVDTGDNACQGAAQAAQLGGNWVAWLSTSSIDAIDRVNDVGPWYDLDGKMIFADRANLMTSPLTALWLDEHGDFLASDKIWTATGFGGTYLEVFPGEGPCADWTVSAMSSGAQVGQVGRQDGAAWTAVFSTSCDQRAHLICLEQ